MLQIKSCILSCTQPRDRFNFVHMHDMCVCDLKSCFKSRIYSLIQEIKTVAKFEAHIYVRFAAYVVRILHWLHSLGFCPLLSNWHWISVFQMQPIHQKNHYGNLFPSYKATAQMADKHSIAAAF